MTLRLSDSELATLVEMVSLATELASATAPALGDSGYEQFEEVEHKVLESAKNHGLGEIIEFDHERDKFRVTEGYQEGAFFNQCMEEFRDSSFWEELMSRLAERDLVKKIGKGAYAALSEEEQRKRLEPLERRYFERFSRRGVDQLHWIEANEDV